MKYRLLFDALAMLTAASDRLPILLYHRVLESPDALNPEEVNAERFEQQMQFVARNFNALPLGEALEMLRNKTLPRRSICITFDDGYRDNFTVAMPILRRYKLPATIFVSPGFLDGGIMWNDVIMSSVRVASGSALDLTDLGLGIHRIGNREERYICCRTLLRMIKYKPTEERSDLVCRLAQQVEAVLPDNLMMTSEQVRLLPDSGIEVGAHTTTHPILLNTESSQAWEEIAGAKQRLEQIVGRPVELFAYPNGRRGVDFDETHMAMARAAGYKYALSTDAGATGTVSDPYALPRLSAWGQSAEKSCFNIIRSFFL